MSGGRVKPWRPTGFVSAKCEVRMGAEGQCGRQTVMAYPAMGGGYMALCAYHGERHRDYCVSYEAALRGEVPEIMAAARKPARAREPIMSGKEFRDARESLGLTRAQLARKLGLASNSIPAYESAGPSRRVADSIRRMCVSARPVEEPGEKP